MKISYYSRGDAAQIVEEMRQLIRQQKGESVEARLMGVPRRNEPARPQNADLPSRNAPRSCKDSVRYPG